MKIIMTTSAPRIESELDPRFGRGAYLLTVDTDTLEWQAHPNPGVGAPGGAGIQAAQFVAAQKAGAVVSGDFGPHAFEALKAANIPMYVFGACRTVHQVIVQFNAGQLGRVGAATREDCHSPSSPGEAH
jgi:predicted Fe-Mo cluster-binding NifX family protein